MANIYLPNSAKLYWLRAALESIPTLLDARARLYTSALILTPATVLAELEAVQATFPGYSAKTLSNWSVPVIIDGKAVTEPDAVSWHATASTAGFIYGAFLTNGAGDRLLGVLPFDSPVPIPFNSELQADFQIDLGSIFNL